MALITTGQRIFFAVICAAALLVSALGLFNPTYLAAIFTWLELPNVRLKRDDLAARDRADAFHGAVKHGAAQVNQRDVEIGEEFQEFERVVARATAYIEQVGGVGRDGSGSLRDEFEGKRGVNRRGLPDFEIGEPFDIVVEPLPDFFNR